MNTFTLPSRDIPLHDAWDVIVVGGGPTGSTAAAAAARDGAQTLLLESTGSLGGSGTSSLVPAWCPFSDKEKNIYRGLAETVLERCKAEQPHVAPDALDWVPIDAERLKRVYDDLVEEHGASPLFQTTLCGVETNGAGRVEALVVANKRGLSAFKAKVYIDGSGDADVCAWAGAKFHQGDASGDVMPATHCFVLANVDDYAYRTGLRNGNALHAGNTGSPIYAILKSGKYPLIPDPHLCSNVVGPGCVGFNAGHLWDVDNTNPQSVSRALVRGRRMAQQYRDALAEFCPQAFGNAFQVMTGATMGIRETRRVVGDYAITLDDYLSRRSFDDEICRNSYFIDVHWAQKEVDEIKNGGTEKWENTTLRYGKGESHGIPYRCLLPRDLQNVLVAGRSISCERIVQGSVCVMPVCLAMGEAAGAASVLAWREHHGDVHAVDVARLRARLQKAGAYLPDIAAPAT